MRINSHTAVFEQATANRPPCHRSQTCARRDGVPTAPPPPWVRGWGSSLGAPRPPALPVPFPNPGPATGAYPHRGHTRVLCGRSAHSAVKHRCVGAPAPPPARRRPPRPTPRLRSPCGDRHPAAHAITSHCARRCLLLWFLTFDKPETLSDHDVRLLRPKTHPRNRQIRRVSFRWLWQAMASRSGSRAGVMPSPGRRAGVVDLGPVDRAPTVPLSMRPSVAAGPDVGRQHRPLVIWRHAWARAH